jgi:hypothetical protein
MSIKKASPTEKKNVGCADMKFSSHSHEQPSAGVTDVSIERIHGGNLQGG